MLEHETAGDRCTKKKAARGSAAFPKKSRELKPAANTLKIGASRVKVKHGAAARRLGDLRRVIANGRAHDLSYWRTLGFLSGNAFSLFKPGRYYEPGRKVPRRWPEATVENALGPKDSPARAAIDALVDRHGTYIRERILDAIAEGMRDGERWTLKHRCLVSDQEAARRLRVDSEEREELGLRLIGAVDMSPEGLELEGRRKKRERDRARKAAKRRADGAKSHQFSKEKAQPWRVMGVSRATYFRRLKSANGQAETETSTHNNTDYVSIDKSVGDETVSRPTPTDDFSIDQGRAPSIGDPSSTEKVERSETASIVLVDLDEVRRRLPAPHGADCGRHELSLSELALLAVYAQEKASGRIREAAR
jgi:hypothetical protein